MPTLSDDKILCVKCGAEQLSDFCAMAEFGLGFVPHDALLVPPQHNYFDVIVVSAVCCSMWFNLDLIITR